MADAIPRRRKEPAPRRVDELQRKIQTEQARIDWTAIRSARRREVAGEKISGAATRRATAWRTSLPGILTCWDATVTVEVNSGHAKLLNRRARRLGTTLVIAAATHSGRNTTVRKPMEVEMKIRA